MMGTKIFYFSGTGNSYISAKEIAEKIDAELTAAMRKGSYNS